MRALRLMIGLVAGGWIAATIAAPAHAQLLPKPPCTWIDAGPWHRQTGPGSVTAGPLLTPGVYTVWIAERLGKPGAMYTPWRPYGPFTAQAGKKYLINLRDGSPISVGWLTEDARTTAYSDPGKNAAVYIYNSDAEKFFGVAVCGGVAGLVMPPPAPASATVNLKTSATLTASDAKDKVRTGCFHRVHALQMEANRVYQITMSGAKFDAFLRLEDPTGKEVARDDDSGPNLDAEIRGFRPAATGMFKIIATTFAAGATGDYTLTVSSWSSQLMHRLEGELTKGTVIGPDKASTPPYAVGKCFKTFEVSLRIGVNYQVDLKSSAFDAFLVIEDSSGRVLAWNDDNAGGRDSQLYFQVPLDGTYRLVATSFGAGSAGRFLMTVHREE